MILIHEKTLAILSRTIGGANTQTVVSQDEVDDFMSFASAHTVQGLVADAVMQGQVDLVFDDNKRTDKKLCLVKLANLCTKFENTKRSFDETLAEVAEVLKRENVDFVVFKGPAVADLYPTPWTRTMGDVDFYVPQWDYDKALRTIEDGLGIKVKRCDVDKHDSFDYKGVHFEMHFQIETFGHDGHQRYFADLIDDICRLKEFRYFEVAGRTNVPMLTPIADLLVVFKHWFNHFIGEGVGLRQTTDLAVMIERYKSLINITDLRKHLQNIGYLKAFDAMVALVDKYFGLKWDEYMPFIKERDYLMADLLMTDILSNGNFGRMDYKHRSGWRKRMETTSRFFSNCYRYFSLAPKEILCLIPKRIMISLKAH